MKPGALTAANDFGRFSISVRENGLLTPTLAVQTAAMETYLTAKVVGGIEGTRGAQPANEQ